MQAFKPAQQMLEIELALRFLECVLTLNTHTHIHKGDFFLSCLSTMPLYQMFEKSHLGFSGISIQRIECFEREGNGEKVTCTKQPLFAMLGVLFCFLFFCFFNIYFIREKWMEFKHLWQNISSNKAGWFLYFFYTTIYV